jgi:anthranilate phosphoribosyltransferase
MATTLATAAAWVRRAAGMGEGEVAELMGTLVEGGYAPEQAADLLCAWSERGETGAELAAVVRFLLARALPLAELAPSIDLCGTGGSGLTRYNVSTTAAFVLCAAGVPVAKHGNKGSGRPNGSFDLLEALRVPYLLPLPRLAELHRRSGVCFLFARSMHPVVGALAGARKLARARVARTVFNLAGPLANPCRPLKQIIGVTDLRTAHVVADALGRLDAGRAGARAVVVCGHPGIDEVSITGPTNLWNVQDGHVHHAIIERVHQPGLTHDQLPGGDAHENARLFERLLQGEEQGALLDLVCTNAGVALDCWHARPILSDGPGFAQARALIADGSAWAAFARHRELATEFSAAHAGG